MLAEPKTLRLLREALSSGYRIDPKFGIAFRPDGSEWPVFLDDKGYPSLQVTMRGRGGHLTVRLHKAVGYVLWGPKVFGGPSVHVRHLDGDKRNCRSDNLALGDARANNQDKPKLVRSDAGRKRALTIGAEGLSEITSRSAATRGEDRSRAYGRIGSVPRRKLSAEQVDLIRDNAKLPAGRRIRQRELAEQLGVKQGTVCDVLAGRCYADVGREAPERRLG